MLYFLSLIILLALFLMLRFSWFIPAKKGLPVLMYHKVSAHNKDFLTVTQEQLETHFKYLQQADYQPITIQDLINFIEKKSSLPKNPILITFDDGYLNNLEFSYPLLKKHGMKASIFLPTAFIGQTSSWDNNDEALMNVENLKSMDSNTIEFALHTHNHKNFKHISINEIDNEILENIQFFRDNNLRFTPALAYAYGGRPKNAEQLQKMKNILKSHDIKLAFRIGNRVNKLPINDIFEIKRIDIRGNDTFSEFKTKVNKGRVKLL